MFCMFPLAITEGNGLQMELVITLVQRRHVCRVISLRTKHLRESHTVVVEAVTEAEAGEDAAVEEAFGNFLSEESLLHFFSGSCVTEYFCLLCTSFGFL